MAKLRLITAFIIALAFVFSGCGLVRQDTSANTPDINPNVEAANYDTSDVTLYFGYRGETLLAGETRPIDVPVSDTLEAAVIRELIKGPSADRDELNGLFWEGITLVDIDSTEDRLFVKLNDEFVSTNPKDNELVIEDGTPSQQKKLAIYSIVNTIVEMGTYSKVQIFVDREGGVRQHITKGEAGWTEDAEKRLYELGWTATLETPLILTPENTLIEALDSFVKKNWTRLYHFTAYTSPDGSIKPDLDDFSDALAAENNTLDSFTPVGLSVAADGQRCVVMLDYTIRTREGDTIAQSDKPVVLVREKDIWKLSYISLYNILITS